MSVVRAMCSRWGAAQQTLREICYMGMGVTQGVCNPQGNHAALIELDGIYANLVKRQSLGLNPEDQDMAPHQVVLTCFGYLLDICNWTMLQIPAHPQGYAAIHDADRCIAFRARHFGHRVFIALAPLLSCPLYDI